MSRRFLLLLFLAGAASTVGGDGSGAPAAAPLPAARQAPPAAEEAAVAREMLLRIRDILLYPDPRNAPKSELIVSKSRLGWEWLAKVHGIAKKGKIDRQSFKGPTELFAILDRDGNGIITAADFDWSDNAPFVKQTGMANALFRSFDTSSDGRLDAKEWAAAFKKLAGKKDHLTPDDLRKALFPPARGDLPLPKGAKMPSRFTRLMGFLSGELGSMHPGPDPGKEAPDFTLKTPDGKKTIKLSSFRGKKPVVLIFGNFT